MRTPASVWSKGGRRYQANPPAWEYEAGAEVRRVAAEGQLHVEGRSWESSRALAEEWVRLIYIERCTLVYSCRSLVRGLDLLHPQSTAIDRGWTKTGTVKDIAITLCKECLETLN